MKKKKELLKEKKKRLTELEQDIKKIDVEGAEAEETR